MRLHDELASKISENNVSKLDRDICQYIEQNPKGCIFDDIIAEDERFRVFEQLSELRTGLVSWYTFKSNAQVMEIGAGFGALTGRLCQMCGHVTVTERSAFRAKALSERYQDRENLDVWCGELQEILDVCGKDWIQYFDYIILSGLLERIGGGSADKHVYSEYLNGLKKLLKSDGKILLAVENRFGLKYFCGAVEPHTNRAFDGINSYPGGTGGRSFSRQELIEVLTGAGLQFNKFYYPLPDYRFPQLIYTDDYLPEKNLKERLIPYYRRSDTLVARESELYDEVIANGVFPFMANSFLVECSLDGSFCDVCYAAVSTDRGKECAFVTTIHESGLVHKVPLYREGQASVEQLYKNVKDLQAHNIPIVEHRKIPMVLNTPEMLQNKDAYFLLELPYIQWPTLSNYIKTIMENDTEAFLKLLDRLYEYILQSSEEVSAEENALLKVWNIKESLDFGPILKSAYMELIPLNCFYNLDTEEFLYFDQEFVRENYPAGYVLFRAIHYIYCFTPNAEKYYSKQKLLEKYHMEDTWDIYRKEEHRFLDEVRNHKRYHQFYRWTSVDKKRIMDNALRLESEEEKIANYQVSDKMKKIWKIELDMLEQVERICNRHGLHYFLVHGTLLGAVRHKGFIPWDDDLDIAMSRKDYDTFLQVAERELEGEISVQNMWTEPDCFFGTFTRLRNASTTGIQERDIGHDCNQGIWIDILPYDYCVQDDRRFRLKEKRINHAYLLMLAKVYGRDGKNLFPEKRFLWKPCSMLMRFYPHTLLCKKFDRALRMDIEQPTEEIAFFSGYGVHRRLFANDFKEAAYLEFAGKERPVPCGYENYLFATMGGDYKKYPPEEERKPRHKGIFDPERPYGVYTQKLSGMFDKAKGKKIILFGAGLMFEDYMKKWGRRYHPAFIVDNDKNKWGHYKLGVEVKAPEEILKIPEEKRHIIICSYYYKEIQKQLQEIGIKDYRVYVQEASWIVKAESNG